jgi:hypothetical protein
METTTITQAEELRRACLDQNKRVEMWIAQNWQRVGLDAATDKSTISRALSGRPVKIKIVEALDTMLSEIYDDPWAWFKPPNDPQLFDKYAPLTWWYDTLELPENDIPKSIFARIKTRPMSDDQYRVLARHYNEWRGRLKTACDAFKRDRELVLAVEADLSPEMQTIAGKTGRVGNPGLRGEPLDVVGKVLALSEINMTLPDIERACATYQQPDPIPLTEWSSDAVEPFAGDEVEDYEERERMTRKFTNGEVAVPVEPPPFKSRWLVRHWWDGSRYQVEDVTPFAQVFDGRWRDSTLDERTYWITGMRHEETRADLIAQKDAWIDDVWESRKASPTINDRLAHKDGIPRSVIEDHFEVVVERIDEEAALRHNQEIERRLIKFNLTLRRRKGAGAGIA